MDKNPKTLDLAKLRARVREKPRTKAGQVRQAWPVIRDLMAAGHNLKAIWVWVNEIGIDVRYSHFCQYVAQLRHETAQVGNRETANQHQAPPPPPAVTQCEQQVDPLANLLEREERRPGFNYNPEPDPKKLI